MKEPKSQKTEDIAAARGLAINKAWIERNQICGKARALLLDLEGWLTERSKALAQAEMRANRFSEDSRRIITNGGRRCVYGNIEQFAEQLIAGKSLENIVIEDQKQLEPVYRQIYFGEGRADDIEAYRAYQRERASVEILKAAIRLQKKAIAKLTETSMSKFARVIAEVRVGTARDILTLLVEFERIVEPDRQLAAGLDPDEADCLRPKPFPHRLLSSEAMEWFMDAVGTKLIEPGELEVLSSGTAEKAPTAIPETRRESWLQSQI